jgi:3-hydroxyisobutyrate dehydrogenase
MADAAPVRVGFIGLGSQGAPMARRIAEAGFPLTLWARRPETLQPFGDTMASTAASPAALAEVSSIVCICVTGDEDVRQVAEGPDGVLSGLPADGMVMVHSTVHPETCIRLHRLGAERGLAVLDAPVSGGGPAAAQGSLLVMVGGDVGHVERARPVLSTFGNPILHLGAIGAGQTAKLVNNLMFTAQLALSLEAFALVAELGLDGAAMGQVFERGSGASRAATMVSSPGFDLGGLGRIAGPLLRKDVRLLTDVVQRRRISPPESVVTLADRCLRRLDAAAEEAAEAAGQAGDGDDAEENAHEVETS